VNVLNKQLQAVDKRWSSTWGVERGASNASLDNLPCYETDACTAAWTDPLVQTKQWKRDMRHDEMLGVCIDQGHSQVKPGN
jgi:hypothetical protein